MKKYIRLVLESNFVVKDMELDLLFLLWNVMFRNKERFNK